LSLLGQAAHLGLCVAQPVFLRVSAGKPLNLKGSVFLQYTYQNTMCYLLRWGPNFNMMQLTPVKFCGKVPGCRVWASSRPVLMQLYRYAKLTGLPLCRAGQNVPRM
jgi:hypothetical protein